MSLSYTRRQSRRRLENKYKRSLYPEPNQCSVNNSAFLFGNPREGKREAAEGVAQRKKMMHMTFYWGKEVTLLLDSWRTTTWTGYLLTLLACVVVSAFYQYLEDRRVRFKIASTKKPQEQIEEPLLRGKVLGGGGKWLPKIGGAALFGVNSAIGYMLMLAVMSFNGGVFVAVVVGLAVGYLLFRSGDEDVATLVVDNPCACA